MSVTDVQLIGQYQELNGNDVMVTVYDSSSCNMPYGYPSFDITTCISLDSNIYNEIKPFGSIYLSLSPGEYFITFEAANYRDVRVNVDLNAKFDFAINADSEDIIGGINEDEEDDVDFADD
ncbi:MAG: hypothetical protein ACXW1B_04675, partial [Nitrososphaeraceae archaeon]